MRKSNAIQNPKSKIQNRTAVAATHNAAPDDPARIGLRDAGERIIELAKSIGIVPLPESDGQERAIAMSEPGTIVTGKSQLRRVAAEPRIFRTDARGNAQVAVSEPCPIEVQMNCRSF